MRDLPETDRQKRWLVCDTNVFLERSYYDEYNWHTVLGYPSVVLVVPPIVLRELERLRRDGNERVRLRARNVRPRLVRDGLQTTRGRPGPVRAGVELLLLDTEPAAFPDDLDELVADDRIVATALDFRWRHRGANVAVLAGDLDLLRKARARELPFHDLLDQVPGDPDAGQFT